MEKQYYKLVRDNIPNIIKNQGNVPVYRILDDNEYITYLNKKLQEEVEEYLKDNNVEELCDIVEVLKAISTAMNISNDEFEAVREAKK